MTGYEPPRRYSNTRPYDDNPAYNGQPPQVQVQQAQYYPPPPLQQQPSYQRARGSSNASQRSNYIPPQVTQQQQLTPYAPSPLQQQYQQSPQQGGYFPQAPPGQYTPDQLHPAQAYNQDPFEGRQRTASTSSVASRRSHRSSHSHHSHQSHGSTLSGKAKEHRSGRKDGERATLGDSLYGIWGTMKSMIPVRR